MSAAPEEKIKMLALAVATGTTIRAWAGEHDVPERTAYSWASRPKFKAAVARHRRELVDRAIGRLSTFTGSAVTTIGKMMLEESGVNDAVRLQAARAILTHCIELSTYAELEARIAAVESNLAATASRGAP